MCGILAAQPGRDGTLTVTGTSMVVNKYSPVRLNILAGSSTVSVASPGLLSLCPGDLVMIYQAQGATTNTTNTVQNGDILAYNNAGLYEFNYVQSINGNTITTQNTFTNSYSLSGYPQLIKVPQYSTLTINPGAGIIAKPWKDTTIAFVNHRFGGLVVVHAASIVNQGTISASSSGFRGGQITGVSNYLTGLNVYASATQIHGGEKGESIAGFQPEYDVNGGRYGRGAQANGGGGGSTTNSSGGGGANGFNGQVWTGEGVMVVDAANPLAAWALDPAYIANGNALTNSSGGGRGGYGWAVGNLNALINGPNNPAWAGDGRPVVGGYGGRPLTNIQAEGRIYFGGGGGAGQQNNYGTPPAGSGGGIVYLISTAGITGTGTIESNGANVPVSINCSCDGQSGGGGGGSIIIKTSAISPALVVNVKGGAGGNQLPPSAGNIFESESGGGGGGGGFTAISALGVLPDVSGGANGSTASPALTEFPFNGTTKGAAGHTGTVSFSFITFMVPSAGSNGPVCPAGTLLLNTSASVSYLWTGPNGFTSALQNPTIVPVSTQASGIYTVITVPSLGCSSIAHTVAVSISTVPVVSATSATICPGHTATLSASGAVTYTWQPAGIISSTLAATSPLSTGFTVTGTAINGCTATATGSISLYSAPALSFTTSAITCSSLGSASIAASGGTGPFSYSWTPTAQTGSAATGLYPATYTVQVFDAATNCTYSPTTTFLPLVPLTGTVSATNSLVCHGLNTATAEIALSGGSGAQSYTWSNGAGFQTTSLASNLAAGISTITVIDGLTYCTVTHTFLITQPPALTLNIAASAPSVCLGGAISFTAANSGGTPGHSYTWTAGPSVNTLVANEATAGPFSYTVTSTDAHMCQASNTITILFVNHPTVSISSTSICPLANANLTAAGATSYSWSTGYTGNPLIVSPGATTEYTVTGSALGCTASATGSVILKPAPSVTFTSNAPICEGQTLQLNGTGTGTQFQWSGPSNFTSTLQSTSVTAALPSQGGNYTLKLTAANSCTVSMTSYLTVNPAPPLTISGSTVCEGSALKLFANFFAGATYSWSGALNTSTLQNPVFSNAHPAMSGPYMLHVTSAAGCTSNATAQASVIALPVPVITGASNYCAGSLISLSGSGGTHLSWFGPGGFNSLLPNPVIPNAGASASGSYSLYAYSGPCVNVAVHTLTVHALPAPLASNNSPVCENANLILSSSSAQSYTWTGPSGFSGSSQSTSFNANNSQQGTYTLGITDLNGCRGFALTTVTVLAAPVPVVSSASTCLYGSVTLTASGGSLYSWSGPMNFSGTTPAVTIYSVGSGREGIYTVTITGTNLCSTTATLGLLVFSNALPSPSITLDGKACINAKVSLRGNGGSTYLWQGPQQLTANTSNLSLDIKDFSAEGIYTLTVENNLKCTASATAYVKVYPSPQAFLTSTQNDHCVPFHTRFSLKEDPGKAGLIETYSYSYNKNTFGDSTLKHFFPEPGTYLISAMFRDTNSCTGTASLVLNAYPKPSADFEYSPQKPLASIDEVNFYNTSGGPGLGEWSWFLTGTDSVTTDLKEPSYLFKNAGIYPLVLVAKNRWGCMDTVIKPVIIYDEFSLYVPDAFSPNSDGLNDVFLPKGAGIENYSLEIFSRWGESLFQSTEFSRGWDGSFKGELCKTDIYVWTIVLKDVSGKTKIFTGHVSLLRAAKQEDEY